MKKFVSFFSFLLLGINIQANNFSFTAFDLINLKEKSFAGHTEYQLINDVDNKIVHAISNSTASGLFKPQKIILEKTPNLTWSWKVKQIGQGNNQNQVMTSRFVYI